MANLETLIHQYSEDIHSDSFEKYSNALENLDFIASNHPKNRHLLQAVPKIVRACKGDSNYINNSIERIILKIGKSAIPKLIRLLWDQDWVIRMNSSQLIGKIGTSSNQYARILRLLEMGGFQEKLGAAEAIGEIGSPRGVPQLTDALNDPNGFVRFQAAYALYKISEKNKGNWKHPDSIPLLLKLLNDDNRSARNNALKALVSIGDLRIIPHLVSELFSNDRFSREFASNGLSLIEQGCRTVKEINEYQDLLKLEYKRLKAKTSDNRDFAKAIILGLIKQSAKHKNELSKDKGILLDDIPKPPKRKKLYQQLRRATNG
jgi:HEAT repeat protein